MVIPAVEQLKVFHSRNHGRLSNSLSAKSREAILADFFVCNFIKLIPTMASSKRHKDTTLARQCPHLRADGCWAAAPPATNLRRSNGTFNEHWKQLKW